MPKLLRTIPLLWKRVRCESLFSRGQRYARKGEHERAIGYYDRAVQLRPEYAQVLVHAALSEIAQEEYEAALSRLHRAVELAPRSVVPHLYLAMTHVDQQAYGAAVEAAEAALEISPENGLARGLLALATWGSGDFEAAHDHFKGYIPGSPLFQTRFLLMVERALRKEKEAVECSSESASSSDSGV